MEGGIGWGEMDWNRVGSYLTEISVGRQSVLGRSVVGLVDFVEPVAASLAVGFP